MKSFFVFFSIAFIVNIFPVMGQCPLKSYDDPDAYAVYKAVIMNEWPARVAKATRFAFQAETTDFGGGSGSGRPMCLKPAPGDESRLRPLITSYQKANDKPRLLKQKFEIDLPYQIV